MESGPATVDVNALMDSFYSEYTALRNTHEELFEKNVRIEELKAEREANKKLLEKSIPPMYGIYKDKRSKLDIQIKQLSGYSEYLQAVTKALVEDLDKYGKQLEGLGYKLTQNFRNTPEGLVFGPVWLKKKNSHELREDLQKLKSDENIFTKMFASFLAPLCEPGLHQLEKKEKEEKEREEGENLEKEKISVLYARNPWGGGKARDMFEFPVSMSTSAPLQEEKKGERALGAIETELKKFRFDPACRVSPSPGFPFSVMRTAGEDNFVPITGLISPDPEGEKEEEEKQEIKSELRRIEREKLLRYIENVDRATEELRELLANQKIEETEK